VGVAAVCERHCAAAVIQWRRCLSADCVKASGVLFEYSSDSSITLIASLVTVIDNSSSYCELIVILSMFVLLSNNIESVLFCKVK